MQHRTEATIVPALRALSGSLAHTARSDTSKGRIQPHRLDRLRHHGPLAAGSREHVQLCNLTWLPLSPGCSSRRRWPLVPEAGTALKPTLLALQGGVQLATTTLAGEATL
jgi:hypothetical protein